MPEFSIPEDSRAGQPVAQPYSMEEFAAQIKAKFPAYASWPTDHLVTEVVTKHPEYAAWVTIDPRTSVAMRKESPPATAHGDPNAKPESTLERIAAPIAHPLDTAGGLLSAVNPLPALMHPVDAWNADMAARGAAMSRLRAEGSQLITRDPMDPKSGQDLRDMFTYAVPLLGPAMAHAGEQMESTDATERASGFGGAVGLTSGPSVAGHMMSATSRAAPALETSGKATYADALAAENTPNRPLAESLGSQLAEKGKVLSNPKKQLGTAFGGSEEMAPQTVQKVFPKYQAAQLETLKKRFPDATITEDGNGNFVVNQQGARSLNQQGADVLAADMPSASANWWAAAKHAILPTSMGAIGGKIGYAVNGIEGAAIGVAAAEAPFVVKAVVNSPLWKTTSGVVKTSLGRAMQAGDFGAVTTIAARLLGGIGLEDAYGHDEALFKLMQSLPKDGDIHQQLQDHDAIYVQPDGSHVKVPFNVQKQTYGAVSAKTTSLPQVPILPTYRREGTQQQTKPDAHEGEPGLVAYIPRPLENDSLVQTTPPRDYLPERFKKARSARMGTPVRVGATDAPDTATPESGPPGWDGLFGRDFLPPHTDDQTKNDTILISRSNFEDHHFGDYPNSKKTMWARTLTHEVGHAVWQDLTPKERASWETLHKNFADYEPDTEDEHDSNSSKVMYKYSDDPTHSFAEQWAHYVVRPSELKAENPEIYSFMKRIAGGKEYIGGKVRTNGGQ